MMSMTRMIIHAMPSQRSRFSAIISNSIKNASSIKHRDETLFWGRRTLWHLTNDTRFPRNYQQKIRNFSVYNSVQPGGPLPSTPPSSPLRWVFGIVVAFVLPFFASKWGPLLKFKNDFDNVVETVEDVIDVAEKVAEQVEKVAEDISDDLPAGGKLKKVVDFIEDVAEETAKDAHLAGDIIDQVQEVEDKVESVVESLGTVEAITPPKSQAEIGNNAS